MSTSAAGLSAFSSLFSSLVSWAALACQIIGCWFIFKKMGLPGWKGIIPYYNFYVLFGELWEQKKFWRYVVYSAVAIGLSILMTIFGMVAAFSAAVTAQINALFIVMIALAAVCFIAIIVICVLMMVLMFQLYKRLAASFGRSRGFAFGLLFLGPVFFMILGFDKSVYLGRQEY